MAKVHGICSAGFGQRLVTVAVGNFDECVPHRLLGCDAASGRGHEETARA
jgi:hypothetical protein